LQSDGQIDHIHQTFHLVGAEDQLDTVSRKVLGLPLEEVKSALLSDELRRD
jgi:hypothetical protein